MAKLFAPILAFTCDEIWQAMPHLDSDDKRNVLLNQMVQPYTEYDLGDMISWASLRLLRDGVNAALEKARADKKIGKALEAHVTLVCDEQGKGNLESIRAHFEEMWADLFIVSDVEVSDDAALYAEGSDTPIAGVRVIVTEAKGTKCLRCWKHHTLVGANEQFPELCPRCAAVVAKLPVIE